MILDELLNILKPLGYPLYPFGASEISNCIVYNFVPITSDKIKEQNRLEITIISLNIETGLKILSEVKEALLTFGDNKLNNDILEVTLNGGGSLENLETNTFHFKANFIIKNRYRKG